MIEAIVLTRRNFREFDEIVSLFSKEQGKLEVLARGVKKTVSKNAPYLEPFSCIHVGIIPGKEIQHITSVHSFEYFSSIRTDFKKIQQALSLVSWLDSILAPGEKDTTLYETLFSWLCFLKSSLVTQNILQDAMMLKSIALLGFEPSLEACVHCGETLEASDDICFSFSSGGVVCKKDKLEKREDTLVSLSFSTLLSLRYILNRSWKEIAAYDSGNLYEPLHNFVYQYILYSTEKHIPDWKID